MAEENFTICSPLRRILAFLIDIFFLTLFFRFVLFILFTSFHWDIELNLGKNILYSGIIALFLFLCKDFFGGRSLGKVFCAIAVKNVTSDFAKPSQKHEYSCYKINIEARG